MDEKNSSYLLGMLCGLIGIIHTKCSEQFLAHSKYSVAVVGGVIVYYSYHQCRLFISNNQALLSILTIKTFTLITSVGTKNSDLQMLDLLMIPSRLEQTQIQK